MILALLIPFAGVAEAARDGSGAHDIRAEAVPFYYRSADWVLSEAFPVYFLDGVTDVPYADVGDVGNILNAVYGAPEAENAFECYRDGNVFILTRVMDGSMVILNFEEKKLSYSQIETLHAGNTTVLIDSLSATGFNPETGEPELFQRIPTYYWNRMGSATLIDMGKYGIPMVAQDGLLLMPLHTVLDMAICAEFGIANYFNGEAVFMGPVSMFFDPSTGWLNPLGQLYYGAPRGSRSQELCDLGYNELCMELDTFYGLRESHMISSFEALTADTEKYRGLLSENPVEADEALYKLLSFDLDDLHSKLVVPSPVTLMNAATPRVMGGADTPLTEEEIIGQQMTGQGLSKYRYDRLEEKYTAAMAAQPEAYRRYYTEVGNTAYITLQSFSKASGIDYYQDPDPADTLSLIIYAHEQITREDSPIENVVLDLSLNSGGSADAAIYVLAWFLGEAPFCEICTVNGAISNAVYRADINMDHRFTEESTIRHLNRYCLISPLSFSCGNLVPWAFKASGEVTLIGQTSGGGSCAVRPMSTAWGATYQISGPYRMAYMKNGSVYDVDAGVDPDLVLTKTASFYDREKLTDIINTCR